jgi:hypothetical protein
MPACKRRKFSRARLSTLRSVSKVCDGLSSSPRSGSSRPVLDLRFSPNANRQRSGAGGLRDRRRRCGLSISRGSAPSQRNSSRLVESRDPRRQASSCMGPACVRHREVRHSNLLANCSRGTRIVRSRFGELQVSRLRTAGDRTHGLLLRPSRPGGFDARQAAPRNRTKSLSLAARSQLRSAHRRTMQPHPRWAPTLLRLGCQQRRTPTLCRSDAFLVEGWRWRGAGATRAREGPRHTLPRSP